MISPLAGSLARTIGKALAPIFLPATLVRNSTPYACLAIFETFSPERELPASDGKMLLLANSLPFDPASGDVVNLQGHIVLIGSYSNTKPAISTDAAKAVWTLNFKLYPVTDSSITSSTSSDGTTTTSPTADLTGLPYDLYRPSVGQTPIVPAHKVTTVSAIFAASTTGFNVNTVTTYDTVLYVGEFNTSNLQPGDYLVGAAGTYFIAALPYLQPIRCVLCNHTVTISRNESEIASGSGSPLPSQAGGSGRYFGVNPRLVTTGAGETQLVTAVPVLITGTSGRATGPATDLAAEAPGPSRWRIYLPPSVCPSGFLKDRDLFTDQDGYRYQVSAAEWTTLGYRCETIRLEA